MRFTDNVDRDKRIFKNTSGKLKQVVLPPDEAQRVQGCSDSEVVLQKLPVSLRIEVSEGLDEPLTFDLKPVYVIWSRDAAGNAKVKRRGFQVVPDFANTAHGYCGDTLDKCKGDLLEWHKVPTLDAMLRAYIIRSRVRDVENCLIVRPYSPRLFQQGTLPGPHLLLQRQKGELTEVELKRRWKEVSAADQSEKNKWEQWRLFLSETQALVSQVARPEGDHSSAEGGAASISARSCRPLHPRAQGV